MTQAYTALKVKYIRQLIALFANEVTRPLININPEAYKYKCSGALSRIKW